MRIQSTVSPAETVRNHPDTEIVAKHTPTPWFLSGVRFQMNGGEWQSINWYDEAKKQDENIALVGYDPRTGVGRPDAQFIIKAVNSHDALVKALTEIIEANKDFRDGMPQSWDGDPLQDACDAARDILAKANGA